MNNSGQKFGFLKILAFNIFSVLTASVLSITSSFAGERSVAVKSVEDADKDVQKEPMLNPQSVDVGGSLETKSTGQPYYPAPCAPCMGVEDKSKGGHPPPPPCPVCCGRKVDKP